MPVIIENATPTIDPRITAYLQKHPLKIAPLLSPSSQVDPRITSYIAKHPLQASVVESQTTPPPQPEPLFRTRRRPNLFAQTPDYLAPTALPKPQEPVQPTAQTVVPEPPPVDAVLEPRESPLPFYEGQPVQVRLTHALGTVVGVGPNNAIFIQNPNGEITTVEPGDLDPIQSLTTDAPTLLPSSSTPPTLTTT